MIARYSLPEMSKIWTEEAAWASWAEVEKAHLKVLLSKTPEYTGLQAPALQLFDKAFQSKNAADFTAREKETGHDVIAFVSELADAIQAQATPELKNLHTLLHKGLTSSDVLDTALSLRIQNSLATLLESLAQLRGAFSVRAYENVNTLCMGRTHGIHAEPMSFGHVLASFFQDFQQAHLEVLRASKMFQTGKLSGAVGNYSQLSQAHEKLVLNELQMQPEGVATQVISRQKFASLAHSLILLSTATERFATNMRHWARTELGEVLEPFSEKQKGSSAMPHKKNPILSENLCGIARTIRNLCHTLEENVALWHERDISHSSAERMVIPDVFVAAHFMVERTKKLVEQMVVRPEVMMVQVRRTGGLWASQTVLTMLVENGMARTEAYELVQKYALPLSAKVALLETGRNSEKPDFLESLEKSPEIQKLNLTTRLAKCFETHKFLASAPFTLQTVFGMHPEEFERKLKANNEIPENAKNGANKLDFVLRELPTLQTVCSVNVGLREDILDTEAQTIEQDSKKWVKNVLNVRQSRTFLVRLPGNTKLIPNDLKTYAMNTLRNEVMDFLNLEVLQ